jgi:hypothetical protein
LNVESGTLRGIRGTLTSLALVAFVATALPARAAESFEETMRFAAEMAKRGNWREAKYRWDAAARLQPDNPRVLNNLGVAWEALGDPEAAYRSYERAAARLGDHKVIETNLVRADRFWSQVREVGDGSVPTYDGDGMIPGGAENVDAKRNGGKSFKVSVPLPVPARLDLEGRRRLLVASFLAQESHLLDVNRELVRFVRGEFRKRTDLEVLPVTPPPAVPEQRLEDMIANHEFWKYLGREYDAEVIVSGVMQYDRRDSSGFRDVDVISPSTGQKVRQSQFVEQERFSYALDVLFFDGRTGELLFRDRLQRESLFRGTQNDPITAFYDLSDSIAPDLLAIVKPRTREDVRFVFKK